MKYDEEIYPDIPMANRSKTGWHWFGGIIGKDSDTKIAMEEALDKLSSR